MKQILFLTACINPNGMAYTALSDAAERLRQYKDALTWYLTNTALPILFVENTGYDLSADFDEYVSSGRLECLTFHGNDYNRNLGKGYGEAKIMQYGLDNSLMLKDDSVIVKVTGRLICKNIVEMCSRYDSAKTVYANIAKDDWGGNICGSSFVIAPVAFWKDFFLPKQELLNDSKRYHFEHLLYASINQWEKVGNRHCEFWLLPQVEGKSGTSGVQIVSSAKRNLKGKVMYLLHGLGYRGYLNPLYHGDKDYGINK